MTTITITLPEELVEQAKAKGLLTSAAIEAYVREKLHTAEGTPTNDSLPDTIPVDPRLAGLINPAVLRKGQINGDIIGPFQEEWGKNT
ncbi:MAG: type II toxin-antitoxin system CcdA family antitoxin [Planctomycetaceae bacterium]|nr:type II toxin-antitoxin system CcdA family antitoxin [Planctomycetaceae bacterium]